MSHWQIGDVRITKFVEKEFSERAPLPLVGRHPRKSSHRRRHAFELGETRMNAVERTIRDVVIANRILAQNNGLDAYGHVSMRHPEPHDRYFLARS